MYILNLPPTVRHPLMHALVFARYRLLYRGEEHGEEVDRGLGNVQTIDGHHDGGQEKQIAEREQQSRCQLATVRLGCEIISAAPTVPACRHTDVQSDTE